MSNPASVLKVDLFRAIVEAAPTAIVVVDAQGRVVIVNRRAEQLFGYRRDDLIGRSVELLVPERFRDRHPAFVADFHADPVVRPMGAGRELYGLRSDGSEFPIEIGLSPLPTPEGLFTLASVIDITERKSANERFRLAVEAAPNAMIMVDRQRRITLVNRKTEELFDYDRRELIGQTIDILVPDRFRAMHPGHMAAFFEDPATRAMGVGRELFGKCRDGTEIPVEIGLNPIQTPEGVFTLAAVIDISSRRRAKTAHEQLAAIVESSQDAIISRSLDGVVMSWNRGAEMLYGYTALEIVGRPVSILMPDRCLEDESKAVERLRIDGSHQRYETFRRRKDGSELEVAISLSPLRDASGEIVAVSAIARDITESKQRDAELRRSNAELEQFAYVASHDLQEPLRMVANYTELLAQTYKGRLDERADQYLHYASDGAKRMQRLVSDLLAYSRVGSQGRALVEVSADAVLDGVLASLRPKMEEVGAVVEREPLPSVLADEVQLGQLFQNLILNAIKFRSAAPPRIVIRAEHIRGLPVFSVADNGIGMDMQHAARIFEMFQRLHGRSEYEGSGIGLTIAKNIVNRHGGKIWVQSTPGQGATFYFALQPAPAAP